MALAANAETANTAADFKSWGKWNEKFMVVSFVFVKK